MKRLRHGISIKQGNIRSRIKKKIHPVPGECYITVLVKRRDKRIYLRLHSDKEQPYRCYGYDYEKKFFHLDRLFNSLIKAPVLYPLRHTTAQPQRRRTRRLSSTPHLRKIHLPMSISGSVNIHRWHGKGKHLSPDICR